jgi:hypothetical protein
VWDDRRVILAQVRDELNQVNWLLDEYDAHSRSRRDRGERRRLLQRAAAASVRGVQALIEDQETKPMVPVDVDIHRALEEMRQDEALLRLFIRTEVRLLEDVGVAAEAIRRIEDSLGRVLLELEGIADRDDHRLFELLEVFERSLEELAAEGRHREVVARLSGVVQALGGALLVGVNGVAGVGTAAATMGLTVAVSAAGAAISIAAGTEVMNRGAARALGS